MTDRQQLESFIRKYDPSVAALARQAFRWMRRKFPGAMVLVYDNYNALAIGFGPGERASEAPFSIAVYPRRVNLCFLWGATLPDPHKRLRGSGKQVRNVILDRIEVLEEPAVLTLIEEAAARAGLSSGTGPPGKIQIRLILAKQRPRRPSR